MKKTVLGVALVSAIALAGGALVAPSATATTPSASTGQGKAASAGATPSMRGGGQHALDTTLISALKSKDHTAAVKKIKIALVSAPSRTLWTSTSRSASVRMVWRISDPKRVAKRIRVCWEDVNIDESSCKSHLLRNFRKPRGDFSMQRTPRGWEVVTAPWWRARSPYQCYNHEYYRPRVRWSVSVVDPRNGRNAATGRFAWTVRCSG